MAIVNYNFAAHVYDSLVEGLAGVRELVRAYREGASACVLASRGDREAHSCGILSRVRSRISRSESLVGKDYSMLSNRRRYQLSTTARRTFLVNRMPSLAAATE